MSNPCGKEHDKPKPVQLKVGPITAGPVTISSPGLTVLPPEPPDSPDNTDRTLKRLKITYLVVKILDTIFGWFQVRTAEDTP